MSSISFAWQIVREIIRAEGKEFVAKELAQFRLKQRDFDDVILQSDKYVDEIRETNRQKSKK